MEHAEFQMHLQHTSVDSPESPERTIASPQPKVCPFPEDVEIHAPRQRMSLSYSKKPSKII